MARSPSTLRHSPRAIEDHRGLFGGLADPVRIRLLNLLAAGELCVCDLTEILGLPQSSVSRHLAYLRRARLVETEQQGKFAHYRLAEPRSTVHRSLLACVRSSFLDTPALDRERGKAAGRVRSRAVAPC
ncbi:MAG TPA: metalloregulator ArsR/SmtB family transcription factor [Gemmatimonadales bacterium]|jgi:ArsR family transcriptional regulator